MVAGTVTDDVVSFKGIPYAAPPLGDLRWRAPQPVEPWEGVLEATAFRNECMQEPGDFEPIQTTPAEDCLYLNVCRPAAIEPRPEGAPGLPVLVWIHGGGYVGGGASVLHLLTSPATEGLFHQVMVLSGGGRKALSNHPMTGGTHGHPSADQIHSNPHIFHPFLYQTVQTRILLYLLSKCRTFSRYYHRGGARCPPDSRERDSTCDIS